jgi:hypothetical protein
LLSRTVALEHDACRCEKVVMHAKIEHLFFALVVLTAALGGCQQNASGPPAASSTPAQTGFSLTGPSFQTGGERIARCAERLAIMHYGVKKQEYGDPWKEPDTFFTFQPSRQMLRVALVGGNKTVDGAKTRVEARLPSLRAVVQACEKMVGAPEGRLADSLQVAYVFTDRSKGELKDVITWEGGKFDLPPDDPAVPADLWIMTMP